MQVTVPAASIHTATIPDMNKVWEETLHLATSRTYPRGYYLMLKEAATFDFYYISKGRITILHGAANGKTQNMLYVEPGNLINVANALGGQLTDYVDSGCQFYCMVETTLWRFPCKLLNDTKFIQQYPHLIANLMTSIGVKMLIMHNTLSNTGTGNAITRICRFALNLSQANNNALELNPRISQACLANLFGLHRTTFLRALSRLKQLGVIKTFTKSRLCIGDIQKLMDLTAL